MRERSEIISFTRDDLERIIRCVAKERIARARITGSMFVGKFGEQTLRWDSDGGVDVTTKYQEVALDVAAAQPAATAKKKKK